MPRDHIVVFHTNDLHGHVERWRGWQDDLNGKCVGGLDRLATIVKAARQSEGADNVLLFDAGDAGGDTLFAENSKGEAIYRLMGHLGYNAIVPGNHEYDFGPRHFIESLNHNHIPVIAANLVDAVTRKPVVPTYVIFRASGRTVALIGLTYPKTPQTTAARNIKGLAFLPDAARVVSSLLPTVRQENPDVVIVLSHLGLKADIELAKSVTGIDFIIGGHSHNRMKEPMVEGATRIVQAGAHGSDVGRIDLAFSDAGFAVSYTLIDLDDAISADPAISKEIASLLDVYAPERNDVIAIASAPLTRAQTLAPGKPEKRDGQSPADCLFADIIRKTLGTDIALLPGVGYGVAIPAGPVTVQDLKNLIPHRSELTTMVLTGSQLRDILEQSVENVLSNDMATKVGGMIQVSGLTFSYGTGGERGTRVHQITVGGEPARVDKAYTVVTNSLLAHGGHNYRTFLKGTGRHETGRFLFDLVRDEISASGHIDSPKDVRVTIADGFG